MRELVGLQEFVQQLENMGELQRVNATVDPRFEVAAIMSEMGNTRRPALLFECVKGHTIPVVGNLLGTRRRMAYAMGMKEDEVFQATLPNQGNPIVPFLLSDQKERVTFEPTKESGILELLPILTHYAKDSGAFITAGITSARDPRNNGIGRGLHRIEVRSDTTLGISLVNPPLSDIYAYHKANGTRMELATAIGVDPAILIGTVLKAKGATDKLASVGGIMGSAVATEMANTIDVEVPAYSEALIEGYIDPEEEELYGTLGEVSGYYKAFKSPTIHITAISLRREAIYQSLLPRGTEVENILAFVYGMDFIPKMKAEFSSLIDIHFVPGTFGAHAVLSIDSDNRGEIRRAATMALSYPYVKKAIMVNPDIDPHDPFDVDWAMATRFQADRDLIVLSDMKGQPIDPTAGDGFVTSKIAIDATRLQKAGFERIGFPKAVQDRLSAIINDIRKRN